MKKICLLFFYLISINIHSSEYSFIPKDVKDLTDKLSELNIIFYDKKAVKRIIVKPSNNDGEAVSYKLNSFTCLRNELIATKLIDFSDYTLIAQKVFLLQKNNEYHYFFEMKRGLRDLAPTVYKGIYQYPTVGKEVNILFDVLHAINFLHANELIHGDIKRENIIEMEDGTFRLCDFSFLNHTSAKKYFCGTWPYYPPEVSLAIGQGIEQKSDIWSLGVLAQIMFSTTFYGDGLNHEILNIFPHSCNIHEQSKENIQNVVDSFFKEIKHFTKNISYIRFLRATINVDPVKRLSSKELLLLDIFKGKKAIGDIKTIDCKLFFDEKKFKKYDELNKEFNVSI